MVRRLTRRLTGAKRNKTPLFQRAPAPVRLATRQYLFDVLDLDSAEASPSVELRCDAIAIVFTEVARRLLRTT